MPVANSLMNRGRHEARCRAQFERQWPDHRERVGRCMERRYPASLMEAVDELRALGLNDLVGAGEIDLFGEIPIAAA